MSDARGVLCAGSLNYDIVVRPVEAPQWGTTTFVDTIDFLVGGNGANTSLALATLGIRTRLAGSIGNDEPARYLLGKLAAAGVDTSGVAPCERPTSATIVMINGEGNRKFLNRQGSSGVAFEEPIDFHAGLVEGMAHFHQASLFILPRLRHSAPETLRRARAAGLATSLDTTWDPLGEWMPALESCLPQLDYLFMNEDEARMVTGSTDAAEAARAVLSRGVRTAVMKLGARGSAVFTREGEVRVPAFDVRCVDTTGAGDCYVAGFLSALMRGGSHEEAARLGNALGALVVEQVGAVTGVRNLEDTLNWMSEARYLP